MMLLKQHKHFDGDILAMVDVQDWINRVDDKLNEILRVLNDITCPPEKQDTLKKYRALKKSRERIETELRQLEMELK